MALDTTALHDLVTWGMIPASERFLWGSLEKSSDRGTNLDGQFVLVSLLGYGPCLELNDLLMIPIASIPILGSSAEPSLYLPVSVNNLCGVWSLGTVRQIEMLEVAAGKMIHAITCGSLPRMVLAMITP